MNYWIRIILTSGRFHPYFKDFKLIIWNLFIGQFVITAINYFLPVRLLDPRKFCGPTFCVATGFVFLDFCIGRGHICVQVPCVRLVCVDLTWPVQKLYTNWFMLSEVNVMLHNLFHSKIFNKKQMFILIWGGVRFESWPRPRHN